MYGRRLRRFLFNGEKRHDPLSGCVRVPLLRHGGGRANPGHRVHREAHLGGSPRCDCAGKTTIIVPTGGTEQNGPHMALGKHNVRIAANGENIARRLGNALVAPVVAYTPEGGIDPPTGHMRFPGTISIPDPVFRQVLEYIARSLKQHGFPRRRLHRRHSGPNQAGQIAVAATLNAEWAGGNTRVHAIPGYYRSDPEGDAAIMMARGIKREQIGNHADPRDTSQMMAVDPTMVRTPRSSPPMARTASRATRAARRREIGPRPHRQEHGAHRRPHSSIHRGAMSGLTPI